MDVVRISRIMVEFDNGHAYELTGPITGEFVLDIGIVEVTDREIARGNLVTHKVYEPDPGRQFWTLDVRCDWPIAESVKRIPAGD